MLCSTSATVRSRESRPRRGNAGGSVPLRLGRSSFETFGDRRHTAVLAPGTPLVIEGQSCRWTRAGVQFHAELEGIAPALLDDQKARRRRRGALVHVEGRATEPPGQPVIERRLHQPSGN